MLIQVAPISGSQTKIGEEFLPQRVRRRRQDAQKLVDLRSFRGEWAVRSLLGQNAFRCGVGHQKAIRGSNVASRANERQFVPISGEL